MTTTCVALAFTHSLTLTLLLPFRGTIYLPSFRPVLALIDLECCLFQQNLCWNGKPLCFKDVILSVPSHALLVLSLPSPLSLSLQLQQDSIYFHKMSLPREISMQHLQIINNTRRVWVCFNIKILWLWYLFYLFKTNWRINSKNILEVVVVEVEDSVEMVCLPSILFSFFHSNIAKDPRRKYIMMLGALFGLGYFLYAYAAPNDTIDFQSFKTQILPSRMVWIFTILLLVYY